MYELRFLADELWGVEPLRALIRFSRVVIPPYSVDSSRFLVYPAAGYLPVEYFTVPGGVPEMGAHWVDATAPEMNGGLFTQTFLYGTYDGEVTKAMEVLAVGRRLPLEL